MQGHTGDVQPRRVLGDAGAVARAARVEAGVRGAHRRDVEDGAALAQRLRGHVRAVGHVVAVEQPVHVDGPVAADHHARHRHQVSSAHGFVPEGELQDLGRRFNIKSSDSMGVIEG
jgi:hypothetical protein